MELGWGDMMFDVRWETESKGNDFACVFTIPTIMKDTAEIEPLFWVSLGSKIR